MPGTSSQKNRGCCPRGAYIPGNEAGNKPIKYMDRQMMDRQKEREAGGEGEGVGNEGKREVGVRYFGENKN